MVLPSNHQPPPIPPYQGEGRKVIPANAGIQKSLSSPVAKYTCMPIRRWRAGIQSGKAGQYQSANGCFEPANIRLFQTVLLLNIGRRGY
jgi:hypothetical protein